LESLNDYIPLPFRILVRRGSIALGPNEGFLSGASFSCGKAVPAGIDGVNRGASGGIYFKWHWRLMAANKLLPDCRS